MDRTHAFDAGQARANLMTTFDLCEFYIPFLVGHDLAAERRWGMLDRERREWLDSFGEDPARVEKPHRQDGPEGR